MTVPSGVVSASSAHLRARLTVLEARVALAIGPADEGAPSGDHDRLRGLYLRTGDVHELLASGPATAVPLDSEAVELLDRVEARVDDAERSGESTRLRCLQRAFGLDAASTELLLVALAPDLDPRFERFYGYLHDDVTRRRASVGLALQLVGMSPLDGGHRAQFGPFGTLVNCGLIVIDEPERPFLTRSVRVPDRVAGVLPQDDSPDLLIEPLLASVIPFDSGAPKVLASGIRSGVGLCYVQERRSGAGAALAATALIELGLVPLHLDLRRLTRGPLDPEIARAASREAILQGGALVTGPIEVLAELGPDAVRAFTDLPCCTILTGGRTWDPTWAREVPLIVRVSAPTRDERTEQWRWALNGSQHGLDLAAVTADLRLTPNQIVDAVTSARQVSAAEGRPLDVEDLRHGARAQNAAGLELLAHRIEPSISWAELVLPGKVEHSVRELMDRWRHRDTVLDQWRMGGSMSRRRGIIALFSGPPGTGKTMAAEVVAGEFGLDLYVINLATVVDKYIGETEKNLERIFTEAEQVNGILFFDEADALFGKRSEVSDARDRYSNIETAYLLQRMETFDGIAILATNLKTNVDEAFARRLDASIFFPNPDEAARLHLWNQCIGPVVPRGEDLDLDFMASSFELAGGNIRNVAIAAAYSAAVRGEPLEMADLIRGTHREYQKLGRLCVEAEFGRWISLIEAP